MQKRIITSHLVLDVITDTDKAALIEIFQNDTVKATYILPDLEDDDKAAALFGRIKALSEQDDRYVRGIYLEGKLIGLINDTDIDGKTVEIGYALHPAFHSKGYMTEAVGAMISALFECGFEQVTAAAFEENAASFRVMQKCGMKRIDKAETLEYRKKTHRCIYYSIKSDF